MVLGACGSSDGKYIAGYGTVSLANAFLASGARGVLAARWKVDDSASAKMISHFFRLISGGERFHSALRQVKLSHIEHAPEQMLHPHLWANYSYFGSIQKLEPVRTAFSLMWLILPVVILASGYFFLKRFHRRAEQKS